MYISQFNEILKDECIKFNEMAREYIALKDNETDKAYNLMKRAWLIAQEWSELQACGNEIKKENSEINISDFKKWAYEKHKQAKLIHESSRMIWRVAKEKK